MINAAPLSSVPSFSYVLRLPSPPPVTLHKRPGSGSSAARCPRGPPAIPSRFRLEGRDKLPEPSGENQPRKTSELETCWRRRG